ncbi:MAG: hypothetical protein JWM90_1386, partial [Thermoleophilia bacterium]|nr:hypothetical protein [Thermoleophilia bacterium]
GAIDDYGESIHLLENGQILFSGFCSNGANDDACIMRLNADGSLDPTFDGPSGGGNGVVLVPIGVGNDDSARVLLQQDGNIVLVGDCVNGGLRAFCAARLTPAAGAFDVTFDGPSGTGNGRFVLPAGAGHVDVFDGAIQEDGRILIAGKCSGATDDFCMARLETTGALDLSFDGPSGTGNGIATLTKVGYEAAYRIIVQDDGMIVLGGECDDKICVTRTTATGALDVAFDGPTGTGNGRIELMTALDGYVGGLAHRSDGDILMAGGCSDGVNEEFCLMMLDGGSTISNYSSTGAGGDTDWASAGTTSMFAACLRSVGGGATTAWMPSDPCAIADGAQWNAIPAAPVTIATTAVAEPDPPDAVARLRFGLRTTATQSPATYVAPITFSILTP